MTPRNASRRRALAVLLLLTGCSHRTLQYLPTGEERGEVERASEAFVRRVERRDSAGIVADVDFDARKALVVFAASLAFEKRARIRAAVSEVEAMVVLAIAFTLLGDDFERWEPGIDEAGRRASGVMSEVLEREWGITADQLESSRDGQSALEGLVTQLRSPKEAQAARAAASLDGLHLTDCRVIGPFVSYRLGLLRHTRWAHADTSRTFVAWKARVQRLHLVELGCTEQRGFVLLSTEDGRPAPRVVLWRFFSPAQHAQVSTKLRAALAAPP
jgi:hypothetical protein